MEFGHIDHVADVGTRADDYGNREKVAAIIGTPEDIAILGKVLSLMLNAVDGDGDALLRAVAHFLAPHIVQDMTADVEHYANNPED